MADNVMGRAERPEFSEDDPFAELTRIMGHDPRQQERAPDQVDESYELESELLGSLDLSEQDDYETDFRKPEASSYEPAQAWAAEPAPSYGEEPSMAESHPADLHDVQSTSADDELDFSDFDAELASTVDRRLEDEPAIDPETEVLDDDYFAVSDEDSYLPEVAAASSEPPAATMTPQAEPVEDDWYFEEQPAQADPLPEYAAPEPTSYSEPSFGSEAVPHATPAPVTAPERSGSSGMSLEEELSMLLAGEEQKPSQPKPASSAWMAPAAALPRETAPARSPEPAPVSEPVVATEQVPVFEEPAQNAAAFASDSFDRVPEVETLDMAGYEPIRSEELDVPELPVEEPVTAPTDIDDLAAELNQAFDFVDTQATAAAMEPSSYAAPPSRVDDVALEDWERDWDRTPPAAPAAASAAAFAQSQRGFDDFDLGRGNFDLDRGNDEFASYSHQDASDMDALEPPPVPRHADNRRRNMFIAGGVVAVALFGVIGVFAMWSGGGSGEPVLLQADADPVRVRPENPGGAVVPNQDNQVYQRVAGGGEEPEPSQARLIDSTEEPVDLTVQSGPRVVGPRIELTADPAKVEDRLEAGDGEMAASATNEDFVALQPRRVRTMVVRPDGSIVPREDTEPQVAEEAVPATEAQQLRTELTQPEPGQTESQMPEQIALAPVARPETPAPQQQTQPAQAQPAQQQQQVAAVDPAPPATTTQTSEWTMQIASQPSAESAQATYQDLARRYSSLLEGRGVNIVRADVEGRTFYRVRIPMASRDEAVNLCTRYQSAGGSCFVSR